MLLHEQPWWPDFVDALRRRPLVQVIPIYALELDAAVDALVQASDGGPAARQPWWPEAQRIAAVHGVEEAARVFQTNERRLRRAIARTGKPVAPEPAPVAETAPRAEPPANPSAEPAEADGPAVVRRPTLGTRRGTRRVVRWSRDHVPSAAPLSAPAEPRPAESQPAELRPAEPPRVADAAEPPAVAPPAAEAHEPAADGPVRRLARRGRTRIIRREPIEAGSTPAPKAPRRRRKGTGPHGDVREVRLDELDRQDLAELVEEAPDDGPRSVEELLETAGEAVAPVEEVAVAAAPVEEPAVEEAAVEEVPVAAEPVEEAAVEEAPVEEPAAADALPTDEVLPVAALRYGWLLEVDGRQQGGLFLAADALAAAEQVARWAGGHVPVRASLRRVGPELRPGAH